MRAAEHKGDTGKKKKRRTKVMSKQKKGGKKKKLRAIHSTLNSSHVEGGKKGGEREDNFTRNPLDFGLEYGAAEGDEAVADCPNTLRSPEYGALWKYTRTPARTHPHTHTTHTRAHARTKTKREPHRREPTKTRNPPRRV